MQNARYREGDHCSETLVAARKVLHGCGVRRKLSSSDSGAGARPSVDGMARLGAGCQDRAAVLAGLMSF